MNLHPFTPKYVTYHPKLPQICRSTPTYSLQSKISITSRSKILPADILGRLTLGCDSSSDTLLFVPAERVAPLLIDIPTNGCLFSSRSPLPDIFVFLKLRLGSGLSPDTF